MTEIRKGELLILGSAITWGFFPVFAVLSYRTLPPLFSLVCSLFVAAIIFAISVTVRKEWGELKNKEAWKHLFWVLVCNSVGYHALYYIALKFTTPGNASLVALTEVLMAFLLFHVWHKEEITKIHVLGVLLMLSGAVTILSQNFHGFVWGDWLIVLAATLSPYGNRHQQKVRKLISSHTLLFVRSAFSIPFIVLIALLLGESLQRTDLFNSLWSIVFVGVVSMVISKILWIEGIHRIPVTKSNTIASLGAGFTILFAWLFLSQVPTARQLVALPLLVVGLFFITKNKIGE